MFLCQQITWRYIFHTGQGLWGTSSSNTGGEGEVRGGGGWRGGGEEKCIYFQIVHSGLNNKLIHYEHHQK